MARFFARLGGVCRANGADRVGAPHRGAFPFRGWGGSRTAHPVPRNLLPNGRTLQLALEQAEMTDLL